MFMVLYSLLLALGLVVSAPWWLWRMAASGRYREGLTERLGFVPAAVRAAVAGKKTVWVHAVSVGEVLAAERLISELKTALGDGWVVAVSTTTATGQKIALERLVGSPVFFYPLDLAFAVRAWLRVLRPSLFVLVESEFWPRMLVECERAGVPVAVVNARVSDRSFPRYMRLRRLWKPLLEKVSLFLAQGEESAERLREIGAPAERVRVSGNLKYDGPGGGENAMVRRIGSLMFKARLIVAGSTHDDEEQVLLGALPEICKAAPDAALLIAPRHPQRFDEVVSLVRATGWGSYQCRHLMTQTEPIFGGVVLILDTIGDLAAMYGIASAAFVGGSLVPKGGQNPLEAARFGVPVVMGPSYENFREIGKKLIGEGSLRIVDRDGLAGGLIAALEEMPSGPKHFEGQTGATRRTVEALLELIGGGLG
jgi:3-deoxy-D-manno-octulosonic-acid transferase